MAEDQIKAIAEEYADKQWGKPVSHTTSEVALELIDFCKYLQTRFCIVEREKVMKSYDAYAHLSHNHPKPSEREKSRIVTKAIADLFGTSMFNQNEE